MLHLLGLGFNREPLLVHVQNARKNVQSTLIKNQNVIFAEKIFARGGQADSTSNYFARTRVSKLHLGPLL